MLMLPTFVHMRQRPRPVGALLESKATPRSIARGVRIAKSSRDRVQPIQMRQHTCRRNRPKARLGADKWRTVRPMKRPQTGRRRP